MRAGFGLLMSFSILFLGCMSGYKKMVGGEREKVFTRIYFTDIDTAWTAVVMALKSYPLDVSNRESGFLRTKWVDNTAHKNFVDSYGTGQAYLKAQFRFRITVAKGFYQGKSSVKVSVQKEQLVKNDVLEDFRTIKTNSVEEKTLLYRIGRIIFVRMKLEEERRQKTEEKIKEFQEAAE